MDPLSVPIITVVLTGLLLYYIYRFIFNKTVGSSKLAEISKRIEKGTRAYLNSQFRILVPFLGLLAVLMFYVLGWRASISFVVGATFSIFSAYSVMRLVVKVHPRVAWEAMRARTKIAKASERGAAINIITGFSYGLQSPIIPIAGVIGAAVFSYIISGSSLYAIAIANIGTDLMIGFIMSADAFGPIVDNADGVSEMTGEQGAEDNLALLDSVGNSMKAYTKALSMTTGTLTAFAIFITFFQFAGVSSLNLIMPWNFAALFIGAALSFLVASLTIGSTAKTAEKMVDEIRYQYKSNPDIMEGKAEPDYERCINISTNNALKEMAWPGLLAVIPLSSLVSYLALRPSSLSL